MMYSICLLILRLYLSASVLIFLYVLSGSRIDVGLFNFITPFLCIILIFGVLSIFYLIYIDYN